MVSMASEGLFRGYSILVLAVDGTWSNRQNKRLVAKALLQPNLSKIKRAQIYEITIAHLNDLGELDFTLGQALDEVFAQMKQRHMTTNSINHA